MKANYKTITANNRQYQRDSEGKVLRGIGKTRLYTIWVSMNGRCYNPNNKYYHRYGGRGICVCDEWSRNNLQGFENFRIWSLANGYKEDLTIDRINNDKGYSPNNCRWTDMKTQMRNRSMNHPITVNGVEYGTIAEAVEMLHREEDYDIIRNRINLLKWSADEAFNEPTREYCKPITVNGVQYKSLSEACRKLGREEDYIIINSRIYSGWTADEAFNEPTTFTINGTEYKSIEECLEALNLNRNTVYGYKRYHNTTLEEAILHYVELHKMQQLNILDM